MRALTLAAGLGLLGGCSWMPWVGDGDDARAPKELVDIAAPIAIERLWERRVGEGGDDASVKLVPAVISGRVYASSPDGTVMALDAETGEVQWRVASELPISAGVGLSERLVLVADGEGRVLALEREDGSERWRARVSSEVLARPVAAEGVVVVRSVDGKIVGLDARTGTRLWVYGYKVPLFSLRGTAPPLVGDGVVVAGLDNGRLVVLSLGTGVPVGAWTIAPARGRTELERMVDLDAEPRFSRGLLFVAAFQGNITAIDLRDGRIAWRRRLSTHAGFDVDRRYLYLADQDDRVWALDQRSGREIWTQDGLERRFLSAPAAAGEHVIVGDGEGYLHWLDRDDGAIAGRVRPDEDGIGAPPVVHGATVFVLGNGGRLSAYAAPGA